MKIICSECKNEIHNAKVYRNPKILTEYSPFRGNAHYVAVADIRTMCENCGHVEDILGVAAEISSCDIFNFIEDKARDIDKSGDIK